MRFWHTARWVLLVVWAVAALLLLVSASLYIRWSGQAAGQ